MELRGISDLATIGARLFAVAVLLTRCSSNEIRRTNLDSWEQREVPEHGISLDVPKAAFEFYGSQLMHWRSNGIADATWFIEVTIEGKSREEFANPLMPSPENPVTHDPKYMEWLRWVVAFHPEVSVFENGGRERQYRRDVVLPSNEIASIHATYAYWPFSEEERVADDEAILRILSSARPVTGDSSAVDRRPN